MPPIEEAIAIRQQRLSALREALKGVPLDHPRLTLEIGCGHGHFLAAYASEHRDEHCVAIDIIEERLEKAQKKTNRAGLTNVSWLRAAADVFLEALPPETRFSGRIFVLFPDPWPKKKHWKHRLIQPLFLSDLAKFTTPGTPLCFRTDHAPYFEAAYEVVEQHPDWGLTTKQPWPFEQETVFEAKAASFQSWIATRK
jgi:tRNA (guanine-N7-)-methyltransferase